MFKKKRKLIDTIKAGKVKHLSLLKLKLIVLLNFLIDDRSNFPSSLALCCL